MSMNEIASPGAAATATLVEHDDDSERGVGCVLLATNGSPEADAALRFARAYAVREELLLRVLTVLETLPMLPAQPAGLAYAMTIERDRGERILDRVRAQLATTRTPPRSRASMLVGPPGATIAEAAREWNAQFIVLGLGRHGTLGRIIAGDTVVRVMRHAGIPVVAVPFRHASLPRRGVVAVDFGVPSLTAMRRAAQLIGTGALHIVHVRPEIDIPATDPDAWYQVYELGVQSLMGKLCKEMEVEYPEIHVKTALLRGHTATQLLEYAERIDADLIALGQHGHGIVDRYLFGSVAQEVVRSARTAVLVTPPARSAE